MSNSLSKFRGLEIAMDNIRMEEQLLPPGFDSTVLPYGQLGYFKKYGFKVSEAFPAIYKKYNGIESDLYIPASLYFYYISPYLVNMNLSMAYVDKNMYFSHFPDVLQPQTIFHNFRGRFYTERIHFEMPEEEVVRALSSRSRFIVKPAIESGRGRDVKLVNGRECGADEIAEILRFYNSDYIIQEVVEQHSVMASLNPTSLNTCRLYTYRCVEDGRYIVLGAAVRFGGEGAFRDNACTGGGFCQIQDDGSVDDKIHRYRMFGHLSLKEMKNLDGVVIPNYDRVQECCLALHRSIPYMDLIGWDIAITRDGDPMLIELNQYPDCEFIQIFKGPMFGNHTDALMERISHNCLKDVTVYKRWFENAPSHYAYNFEIGKEFSI